MSFYSKLHTSIAQYYANLQAQYSIKYLRELLIALFMVITIGSGYFLYRFYAQHREQQAFVALSEVIDSYMQSQYFAQSLNPEKDREKIVQAWSDTEILLDALYKENINSDVAPYFLVYKSNIVLERDRDVDHAIEILDNALKSLSKNSIMGSCYRMKRIEMGMDSKNEQTRQRAVADLIAAAEDTKSYTNQKALFSLGNYYLSIGESAKAQAMFQKLVDQSDSTALIKSPWLALAEEKLGVAPSVVAE